jgi:hypothetical protein
MIPPKDFKSYYKLENYMEWMGKFKMSKWKIADIDNFMLGNPLIIKDNERQFYQEDIFKGSKYDPRVNIDIKKI